MFDAKVIRDNITINQVYNLFEELGLSVNYENEDTLILETACHNNIGEGSHKLYYYDNKDRGTSPFMTCYTNCGTFDLLEFLQRFFYQQYNKKLTLLDVAEYIILHTDGAFSFSDKKTIKYTPLTEKDYQNPKIKIYDKSILENFPKAYNTDWINEEGISKITQDKYDIRFNFSNNSILIPSIDINNNLISIRERFLSQEDINRFGKYRPLIYKNKLYSTPTSYSLFGLSHTVEAIKKNKKVVVAEAEKSVMLGTEFFDNNNIIVAMQGSSFSRYHLEQLKKLDVKEIIIAFDKQFQNKEQTDEEFVGLMKKIKKIENYKKYFEGDISYIIDENNLTSYKDSPIDEGKDIFLNLYQNRKSYNYFKEKYSNCFEYYGKIKWTNVYDF